MSAPHSMEALMRECIELARKAKTNGETAVGAVVVREGRIVGCGRERTGVDQDPTAHAEIMAVRRAIDVLGTTDLGDCGLVTTVEPCAMCAYVLRETGIQAVTWGVDAGAVGGAHGRHQVLSDAHMDRWGEPPEQNGGVLETACSRVLER